jgi:hypothetical protein
LADFAFKSPTTHPLPPRNNLFVENIWRLSMAILEQVNGREKWEREGESVWEREREGGRESLDIHIVEGIVALSIETIKFQILRK